jgi:hypothetical protein
MSVEPRPAVMMPGGAHSPPTGRLSTIAPLSLKTLFALLLANGYSKYAARALLLDLRTFPGARFDPPLRSAVEMQFAPGDQLVVQTADGFLDPAYISVRFSNASPGSVPLPAVFINTPRAAANDDTGVKPAAPPDLTGNDEAAIPEGLAGDLPPRLLAALQQIPAPIADAIMADGSFCVTTWTTREQREQWAITWLAMRLKPDDSVKFDDFKDECVTAFEISGRQYKKLIWPKARELRDLREHSKPGPKKQIIPRTE